jgi:hypothetical protein
MLSCPITALMAFGVQSLCGGPTTFSKSRAGPPAFITRSAISVTSR